MKCKSYYNRRDHKRRVRQKRNTKRSRWRIEPRIQQKRRSPLFAEGREGLVIAHRPDQSLDHNSATSLRVIVTNRLISDAPELTRRSERWSVSLPGGGGLTWGGGCGLGLVSMAWQAYMFIISLHKEKIKKRIAGRLLSLTNSYFKTLGLIKNAWQKDMC